VLLKAARAAQMSVVEQLAEEVVVRYKSRKMAGRSFWNLFEHLVTFVPAPGLGLAGGRLGL
jgi:hypothetical protein